MRLLEVDRKIIDGRVRLTARMENAFGKALPAGWFEYPEAFADFVREDGDVFVPVMLVASWLMREKFATDLPVSAEMAENLLTVEEIFAGWFPRELAVSEPALSRVESKPGPSGGGVGAFFSCGVDSFHTVLWEKAGLRRGIAPLTHLVYMGGIETALNRMKPGKDLVIKAAAEALGYPVIIGGTNLRDCFDTLKRSILYGSIMASTALSLSAGFRAMLIPADASYRYEDMYPHGSHAMLDRQWSTEYMKIRQDGCDMSRAERVAGSVAGSAIALKYLSVCARNFGAFENCGVCPKCVRTQITLQALGVLGKCATLPSSLDYGLIRTINLDDRIEQGYAEENLQLARATGRDHRLVKTLEAHLRRWKKYRALVTLVDGTWLRAPAHWIRKLAKNRTEN